ncbi:MAG: ComEA family DNA-binding protein [Oscillospiraceae bacterium]|nr:ComEA family DNA-binding protein [Oscillospiraceae bacterium]
MRLRKIEFYVIALTLAFVFFVGGYFVGSRGKVSIVAAPQSSPQNLSVSQQQMAAMPTSISQTYSNNEEIQTNQTAQELVSEIVPEDIVQMEELVEINEEIIIYEEALPGALRGGDGKININTASKGELMDLPGIGDVLSGRIIEYRNRYGNFRTISDIMNVSGIGVKKYEALMDKITV